MRRIEMVHYMSDALYQFFPDMELNKRNLIADVMLKEAEKYGMKPPYVKFETPEPNGNEFKWGGYEWEEDEKVNT